jgi:hypothetical protein
MQQRAFLALLVMPFLLGCEKSWTSPVLELRCGATRLRFEERGRDQGFPSGALSFTPALLMNDGSGWVVATEQGAHAGPQAYARLLPAAAGLHLFPGNAGRTPPWVLFVDPAAVNDTQYAAICRCLDANVNAVDAAWDRTRPPAKYFDSQRRLRIASMVHVRYDDRFNGPDRTTLGARWECPGGTFLKTEPPDSVSHCVAGQFCISMGRISDNASTVTLYPPSSLGPAMSRIAGPDPQRFYGQCRDASGRSLFDTLRPAPWKSGS